MIRINLIRLLSSQQLIEANLLGEWDEGAKGNFAAKGNSSLRKIELTSGVFWKPSEDERIRLHDEPSLYAHKGTKTLRMSLVDEEEREGAIM